MPCHRPWIERPALLSRKRSRLSTAAALACLLILPLTHTAGAMAPMGEVSGEVGGEAFVWETLDMPAEGTATGEFEAFGPVTSVSIQGHEKGGERRMHNVLTLDISVMGEGSDASLMDVDVGFYPNGMSGAFYISTDAPRPPEINFDMLDLSGAEGAAEGDFSALLCRQDSFMSPPDLNDCIEAQGQFSTRLRERS